MRTPESCPYRAPAANQTASGGALCGLVQRLTGAVDPAISEVDRFTCEQCCAGREPTSDALNDYFASHLYRLALTLGSRGGVPGCDVDRITRLIEFAGSQLPVVVVERPDPLAYVPQYSRHCFYLGGPLNESGADDASANDPDRRRHCRHELISETTLDGCKSCRYYDPQLRVNRAVQLWAAGVLTAPRPVPTLSRTLDSLQRAGWSEVRIFTEPGVSIPSHVPERLVTRRAERIQAWPNFLLALMELMMRQPHADAYLLCEDDVLFCGGLRAYLEETLWPASRLGVVSLFTSDYRDPRTNVGFFPTRHGLATWGAQALVFPNVAARAIVRHPDVINHRSRGPKQGRADNDAIVGHWCAKADLDYFMHSPSLVQHIGETSSLWENAELGGLRVASTFPGENADIRDVMSGLGQPIQPAPG